jgi:hypothetical protein
MAVLISAGMASVAYADDEFPARPEEDLPARVGRIADVAVQLYLSMADRPDDWMPVGVNHPVTSGDNLWVSSDGRAEIDYGDGQLRLAGDTNVHVARLDDHQLTLFVARGRLIVRVRILDVADVAQIDTPNTHVALMRPGLYRIEVAADGSTTKVGVREGESLVALASGSQQALPGQMVTVSGIESVAADVRNGFGIDGFDTWSANRDRYYEHAKATPYVSRQMVGVADLDQYGSWEDNPTYGPVWYPTVVTPDWAPYRDGYWTDVGAWGLTWVDAALWGYAPSHYGRWVHVHGRWGWCPGPRVRRPHWAPALVGWYGGASWGITANGGEPVYAWVPLGWGDAYTPWWRGCSQSCWNRYNKPFGVDPACAHERTPTLFVSRFSRGDDRRPWRDARWPQAGTLDSSAAASVATFVRAAACDAAERRVQGGWRTGLSTRRARNADAGFGVVLAYASSDDCIAGVRADGVTDCRAIAGDRAERDRARCGSTAASVGASAERPGAQSRGRCARDPRAANGDADARQGRIGAVDARRRRACGGAIGDYVAGPGRRFAADARANGRASGPCCRRRGRPRPSCRGCAAIAEISCRAARGACRRRRA